MSERVLTDTLDFELPPELEATVPPEARGLTRDSVKLMVSYPADNRVIHTQFNKIADFLVAGDVVVINTSGTLNAAFSAKRSDGKAFAIHLSTHLPTDEWIIEVRQPDDIGTKPFFEAQVGEVYQLSGGGNVTLIEPFGVPLNGRIRLWRAELKLPMTLDTYLKHYGNPIRYRYVPQSWDSRYYQTVYVTEMGSAEMPSAGRAFTPEIITQLCAKGVLVVPLLLHTGVSSMEEHELPYAEYYGLPAVTARVINLAHENGGRVIAVGTTVVRTLETVVDETGLVHAGEGWTETIVTPQRGVKVVDGLLSGLHEPKATHLAMLEALAPRQHLAKAYGEALEQSYLWHEFGDLHLILNPPRPTQAK
ncbi:MAG: S-adenosylmethionine:tRNA ribosyltransferase-isomerase [Anaerolineaceae bacterium]|nr:S-adenosylmethionine:tRNA ribosyltransferase-isomerase [Anaerolineaceae bacterium]